MHNSEGAGKSAVVIRPGALGDVLVTRHLLRFLRRAMDVHRVVLVSPGERGRLLCRPGWADTVYDWERAPFSWLFSSDASDQPELVREVFHDAWLIVSFVADAESSIGRAVQTRLQQAAPHSRIICCPPRPGEGVGEYVGKWLIHMVGRRYGYPSSRLPAGEGFYEERMTVATNAPLGVDGNYLVIHPGSGSRKKNWPISQYMALIGLCHEARRTPQGERLFSSIVVTSGEADGDIGERLAEYCPSAVHIHAPSLEYLAGVLAGARCYVGNDSGVSHLAASVVGYSGMYPKQVLLFGPSDSAIWTPPEAHAIVGGEGFSGIDAVKVMEKIHRLVCDENA